MIVKISAMVLNCKRSEKGVYGDLLVKNADGSRNPVKFYGGKEMLAPDTFVEVELDIQPPEFGGRVASMVAARK